MSDYMNEIADHTNHGKIYNKCGKNELHWVQTNPGKWKLFDGNRPHVCAAQVESSPSPIPFAIICIRHYNGKAVSMIERNPMWISFDLREALRFASETIKEKGNAANQYSVVAMPVLPNRIPKHIATFWDDKVLPLAYWNEFADQAGELTDYGILPVMTAV